MHNNNGIDIKTLPILRLVKDFRIRFIHLYICDLCGQKTENNTVLCNDCGNDIARFNLPELNYDLLNWPMFYHAIEPVTFDHLFAIAPYQWPYSRWIIQLKYTGNFEITQLLSKLMIDAWQLNPAFEQIAPNNNIGVIAVPIHIKKWQKRGYNQSYLLAQKFCKKTKIPHLGEVLTRSKETIDQVGLTGIQRRKNLKKAFTLQQNITLPDHIILIDDVLTTGSTANEISRLLKQQGVKIVTVFTLCLSVPSQKKS